MKQKRDKQALIKGKIEINAASELIQKWCKKNEWLKKAETLKENLDAVISYLEILNGYLLSIDGMELNEAEVYPFIFDLRDKAERAQKAFKEFQDGFTRCKEIRPYLEDKDGETVFVKYETTTKRIPTYFKQMPLDLSQGRK